MVNQLKNLRKQFSQRTELVKTQIHNHYGYEDDDNTMSDTETASNAPSTMANRLNILLGKNQSIHEVKEPIKKSELVKNLTLRAIKSFISPIKQQNLSYLLWLSILSTFYLYNLVSISLRFSFDLKLNSTSMGNLYWSTADYIADLVYLIDIFAIKTRIKFIKDGLWVSDYKSMALNHVKSLNFLVI
jgi:hypothetical protein